MQIRTGKEDFTRGGNPLGFTLQDFWQFQFSNIYDLQEHIAEFLVAKALGINEPHNRNGWTLWDVDYEGLRIEIKETGYYYSWQENGHISKRRSWGITKAFSEYKNPKSEYKRQSDVYVFCLNTGESPKDSDPLNLEHWEFYIVKTKLIDEKCGDHKSISLNRVRALTNKVSFEEIKPTIDQIIRETKLTLN